MRLVILCAIIAFGYMGVVKAQSCPIPPSKGKQAGPYGSGGLPPGGLPPENPGSPYIEWPIRAVHAQDPNDILGPYGYDTIAKWVSIKDRIEYRVRFENDPRTATAPAQNVFVHIPVHPGLNINSLKLGGFGFGHYTFQVPDNTSYYSARLDVRDSLNLFVDVTAGIDITKHEVFWIFKSIDPVTGVAPTNALSGFLPVNDTSINRFNDTLPKKGEGYVNFRLLPRTSLNTGDTVSAKATIVFDTNEEIPTNIWTNTIDAVSPGSDISLATLATDTVTLFWGGSDDAGGTGIRDYSLYYSENGGTYLLYRNHITGTTEKFIGTPGNTYCFFTLAYDNTGNPEPMKNGCDISVQVPRDGGPSLPVNWVYFRGKKKEKDVLLEWGTASESNTDRYEIERSSNAVNFARIGNKTAVGNSNSVTRYDYLDVNATQINTKRLYYRLKQFDTDGKFTYSNIISISLDGAEVDIKVYPNPFDKLLTLMISSPLPSRPGDFVQLVSPDGKIVYRKTLGNWQSNTPLTLGDLPSLRQGAYILAVNLGGTISSIKLIRQ